MGHSLWLITPLCNYKDSDNNLLLSEAGKPKRERDEIFVGKWDEKTHLDYAKNSKKSVVTREPVVKGAKPTKPVKEAQKPPVDEQETFLNPNKSCVTLVGRYF